MDVGWSSGEPKIQGMELKASNGSLLEGETLRRERERERLEVGEQMGVQLSFYILKVSGNCEKAPALGSKSKM